MAFIITAFNIPKIRLFRDNCVKEVPKRRESSQYCRHKSFEPKPFNLMLPLDNNIRAFGRFALHSSPTILKLRFLRYENIYLLVHTDRRI